MIDPQSPASALPSIDLRRDAAEPAARRRFLADLREAAHEVGFFYLTGHGVAENDEVLSVARKFFDLPAQEKHAVAMVQSPHFRGYSRVGAELTRGRPDRREQFDIGAERDCRWRPGDPAWMRLLGPNQWPGALPELRSVLLSWQGAVTAAAARLLRAFAEALGQPAGAFEPVYRSAPNQHIKIIRYPAEDGGGAQGVGAHKDSGLLTLVLQDDVGGLEVESRDGSWIAVAPLAGSLVVNIGELLEIATSGYLRATVHRVVPPAMGRDRLSAAFFLGASHEATTPILDPPPELAGQARGPAADPDNPLFRHAGENYLKGRLRSHPDVAGRHYADL